ncbi:hypothetical protein SERLA73DRAFT_53841 [Serpula lacrymans var. lacrymans S7.3]|uniref:Uncharacterized protein n=2 Tax=Serpula lacrymans var. lacrymans TaxID=341189 RepID=F8PXA3_SERL3|nr:hypothetical protein SERLA73DRAFT_53841 [Serpula lacrymans var. lacrymans S7.3]
MKFAFFRRKKSDKETSWEVVGCIAIDPVPVYDDDDDLDISYVREMDTCGTYVFDNLKHFPSKAQLANAVLFAQQQLLHEVARGNYHVLLLEG